MPARGRGSGPSALAGRAARLPDWLPDWVPALSRALMPLVLVVGLAALVRAWDAPAILAGMVALLGLAIVLVRPRLAMVAFAFLLYTNIPVLVHQRLGMPSAVAGAFILILAIPLADQVMFRGRGLRFDRTFVLMMAFLGALLVSSLVAVDMAVALGRVQIFLLEGVLVYWLVVNVVRDFSGLHLMMVSVLAAGALLGLLTAYQSATRSYGQDFGGLSQRNVETGRPDRAQGPMNEANRYAQVLIVLVPLALLGVRRARRGGVRVLAALAGIAILSGIALTYSRGAFVTLVVLLLCMRAVRWVGTPVMVGLPLVLVLSIPIFAPKLTARVLSLGATVNLVADDPSSVQADGAIRGRATEMLAAFNVFRDHPVIGVGPGQYRPFYSIEYHQDPTIQFRDIRVTRRAHSLYLELAAESGAVGLGIFLALVALLLRDLWRLRERARGMRPELEDVAIAFGLSLLGYLGTAVFLHLAFERYLWFLLGLTAAAVHLLQTALSEPSAGQAPRRPAAVSTLPRAVG